MDPALISAGILILALVLFVSDRIRHDLVAVIALFAGLVFGVIDPETALKGFADPAVIAVAAVLVVGRAVELSGVASAVTRTIIPHGAPFQVRLIIIMLVGAVLSAFMNNIAALVITMPIASQMAIDAKRSPTHALMPLAFATILGGMTTLIGTPPNLILSSIREAHLGEPMGFFQMTPLGATVAAAGLVYMSLIGWRLLPERRGARRAFLNPWRVYEMVLPDEPMSDADLRLALRKAGARLLRRYSSDSGVWGPYLPMRRHERALVISRKNPWTLAEESGLEAAAERDPSPDAITIRAAVAHGSNLIGHRYDAVAARTDNRIRVVSSGPRAAQTRQPLSMMRIEAGDQLFLHGAANEIGSFITTARLLEIGRHDAGQVEPARAAAILMIFGGAILATVAFGISPAITFFGAAAILAATRLLAPSEVYRAIDWPVILLLAAMIPVGQSFEETGAAAYVSNFLGEQLQDQTLFVALTVLGGTTLLLSTVLNNVATAIIMGPLAIQVAEILDFSPDAALLMILVGASSAFLAPIGHQNNLLVMGPGGYRFADFARMGAGLSVIVILVAAVMLGSVFA